MKFGIVFKKSLVNTWSKLKLTAINPIDRQVVAWIDEAETMKHEIWEVFTPSVREPDSQIIVTFNPKRRTDRD